MPLFTIESDQWYASLTIGNVEKSPSGNGDIHSPIRVKQFAPLKSGNGVFDLHCFHPFASDGVSEHTYRLQTINRGQQGLMAKQVNDEDQLLYFSNIDLSWMHTHFPNLVSDNTPVNEWLERAYRKDSNALVRLLSGTISGSSKSIRMIDHWGSDRYWSDAYAILESLDHKRSINLDLEFIRQHIFASDSVAYRLMDAMHSVKELEGCDGFKGAPRLLLLALARLEELSRRNRANEDTHGL